MGVIRIIVRDLVLVAGLGLVWWGLNGFDPRIARIVIGAVLAAIVLWSEIHAGGTAG